MKLFETFEIRVSNINSARVSKNVMKEKRSKRQETEEETICDNGNLIKDRINTDPLSSVHINNDLHLKWKAEETRIIDNGNLIKDKINTDALQSGLINNNLHLKCSLINSFYINKIPRNRNFSHEQQQN